MSASLAAFVTLNVLNKSSSIFQGGEVSVDLLAGPRTYTYTLALTAAFLVQVAGNCCGTKGKLKSASVVGLLNI